MVGTLGDSCRCSGLIPRTTATIAHVPTTILQLTLIYRGRDTPFKVAQEVVRHHLAKPALPVGHKSDEETGFQPTTRRTCKGGDTDVSPALCMTRHEIAGSIHYNAIMNSIGYYMTFSIAPEPENRFFGPVCLLYTSPSPRDRG